MWGVWVPVIVALIAAASSVFGAVFNFIADKVLGHLKNISASTNELMERITVIESDVLAVKNTTESNRVVLRHQVRYDLQEAIHQCLLKGFRTIRETSEVGALYDQYHETLGGNGQIEDLYEKSFLDLPVQEGLACEPFKEKETNK